MFKLFGNNRKSKIEVKDVANSTVNIISIQSDSEQLGKLLSSQIDSGLKNLTIINNDFIYNSSSLLQTKHISNREKVVDEIINKWSSKVWLNIEGGYDTGKSQLSLLIKTKLNVQGFWFSLKGLDEIEIEKALLFLIRELLQNLIKQEESCKNNYLVILDDLPRLGLNDRINNLFIQLITYCKNNNIKLLSTSNFKIHSKIKSVIDTDFIEINIQLLSSQEIIEIIQSYTRDEKNIKYAGSILSVSQGYPVYVQVICKYLKSKNWSLNVDDFFDFLSGKAFDELEEETYERLLLTTEDEDTRELLYRLNLVSGDISDYEIKLISDVSPEIRRPFEKISKLKGSWLQQDEKGFYLSSPLIKRLGKENLSTEVIKNINIVLGKYTLAKGSLNQYDAITAIVHFIHGESFDEAGIALISVLQFYISKPQLFADSHFGLFWINKPIPSEMSTVLKVYIRSLQLLIHSDLRASKHENYNVTHRNLIREDLENLIISEELEPFEITFPKAILFKSYILEDGKKAVEHFYYFVNSYQEVSESKLLDIDGFSDNIWILLHKLSDIEDLEKWFASYKLLNKPIESYNSKNVDLFSKMLCDNLVSNSVNHNETINVFNYIDKNASTLGLEILRAFSARAKVQVLCEKINDLIRAETFVDKIIKTFKSKSTIFLIKDEIGRQQFYHNKKEKSLQTLLEIVDFNVSYITKIDLYLTLAKIFGENDVKLAHYYTKEALDYGNTHINISNLTALKLKCEYAVSQWFIGDSKGSIYTLSDTYEQLLISYDDIDSFENIADYNITVLRIGSIFNYIFQVLERGFPPNKVFSGAEYSPPSRGVFNSNYDSEVLNDWYYEERKYLNVHIIITAFEFFNDLDNAIKWANIGFELNKIIKIYAFKLTLRKLIIYKIMQDEYLGTIAIENELTDFEQNSNIETASEIENEQQKKIFVEALKTFKVTDSFDDYRLTFNIIPILLRKLMLLCQNVITKEQVSESLMKYVKDNETFFTEKEAIESIIYILENFPNNYKESKNLLEWVNNLRIESIRPVQIVCYLICSFEAPPMEALKAQLSVMPYLEKVYKGISKGTYLFLLYPLMYKFWTKKVIEEPNNFYFLELWQKNLKKNIDVKEEHKLVAIYTLVCMHVAYKPNDYEQQWMQGYINEVIINNS